MIEINHCLIGRFECSFGENSCCYMAEGDLSISSMMKKSQIRVFRWTTITVFLSSSIWMNCCRKYGKSWSYWILICTTYKNIFAKETVAASCGPIRLLNIFFGTLSCPGKRKPGYMKVKMLELLLFLSDLNTAEEVLQTDYFNQNQVALIKAVASYITEDLTAHHTIEQLSQKFAISTTALKKCFRGVYGTSVYSYLRTYRLQVAKNCCWKPSRQ